MARRIKYTPGVHPGSIVYICHALVVKRHVAKRRDAVRVRNNYSLHLYQKRFGRQTDAFGLLLGFAFVGFRDHLHDMLDLY